MAEITMTRFEHEQQDSIRIPRASCPEEVGIPSEAVKQFVLSLEEAGFRYHSIYIMRAGKVAAECHRYPFSADMPHILYSISKSVTSCAVGLAIEEGYLTLDTSVADVFPEYVPMNDAEAFAEIKVRNLLNMTSGKFPSYMANKTKSDWIRQFADAKWYAKPGEQFKYINENPYMLCAMLRRVTGMTVTEYLTPRLWEPLGVKTPYWETDPTGTESGGWGLFLTPESFAKFTLMIHQHGQFGGRQIIPRAYLDEATTAQIPTGEDGDHARGGYGYCFWVKNENEFLGCGVFGQIGYSIKDKDLAIVTVSGDGHTQHVYSAIDALASQVDAPSLPLTDPTELNAFLTSRAIDVLPEVTLRSALEESIQDKILWFSKTLPANLVGFPPSVLPVVAVYMTKDRAGNMDRFQFRFCGDYALFQWREGDETCCVRLGMDGRYRISRITLAGTGYTIYGAAFWKDEDTLEVWLRPVESIGIRYLTFSFHGKKVTLSTRSEPSLAEVLEDVRFTVDETFHTRLGKNIGGKLFDSLTRVVEPTLHGEILEKGAYQKKKAEEETQAEVEKEMEEIELPDDETQSERE